jgi:polyisoprenoid-binding protein YceI
MKAVGHQRMAACITALLIAPLSFALVALAPAAAATRAGKVCTTPNAKSGSLTCTNKAGRLIWATAPKAAKPVTTKPTGPTGPKAKATAAAAVTPPKQIVAPGATNRGPALPSPALPSAPTKPTKPTKPANTTKPTVPTVTTVKPGATPPVAGSASANAPTVPGTTAKPAAPTSPAGPTPAAPTPTPPAPAPAPAPNTPTTSTTTTRVAQTSTTVAATNPPTGVSPIEGTWKVNSGEVGYRVKQTVSGQPFEAVGRTKNVTGSMNIEGTVLKSVEMTLATTTFKSEPADGKRDSGVQQVLETAKFPTATISLAAPFDLGQIPADKVEITKNVTFKLTLHGVAKNLTIPIKARRNGATVEIVGSAPIVFADFGIADPSRRPALISEDRGVVEFVVSFGR